MAAEAEQVLRIEPGRNPLSLWRRILEAPGQVALADEAWRSVERSRAVLENALAEGHTLYGVNTGFGKLAQTRVPEGELRHLQRNLVLSHAAGVGELLPDPVVRLVIALKIASLARGFSMGHSGNDASAPKLAC